MVTDTSMLSTQKKFQDTPLWRPWMEEYRLRQISSLGELEEYLDDGAEKEVISWDTETNGLDPDPQRVVGHSFSYDGKEGVYVPVHHRQDTAENLDSEAVWHLVLKCIEEPKILVVYNYKFEGEILRRMGKPRPSHHKIMRDAMIYVWVQNSNRKEIGLKHTAKELLSIDMLELEDVPGCVTGKGKTREVDFSRTRPSEATLYAAADPVFTLQIYQKLKDGVLDTQPFIVEMEHHLLESLFQMEQNPVTIDRAFLKRGRADLIRWRDMVAAEIYKIAKRDFPLGSPQAVAKFLEEQGVKLPKTKSGKHSATGAEVIEKLVEEYPICEKVLRWRTLDKERGTYVNRLLEATSEDNPTCFFKIKSVGAPTGRFSSGDTQQGERYAKMNSQSIPSASKYPPAKARKVKNPPISEMDGALRLVGHIEDDPGEGDPFDVPEGRSIFDLTNELD